MPTPSPKIIIPTLALVCAALAVLFWPRAAPAQFDAQRAYADVVAQVGFGPRTPGSTAHAQAVMYIQKELEQAGWAVEIQETSFGGQPLRNIVATRKSGDPAILLGAHYDSRIHADADPNPENHLQAVPGANDGASGVAVLLEIARVLPENGPRVGLVFFDGEDNGHIPGWDWIYGSRAFVQTLAYRPEAFILVDMIGDADLNIYKERNSDPGLTDELWAAAARLGYENAFRPEPKYRVLDDHIPFIEKGIRAVDIIDLDYPHWHTLQDTPDKVAPESLKMVGDVLLDWLAGQK